MPTTKRILVILDTRGMGHHYFEGIHDYFSAEGKWELHYETPNHLQMIPRIEVALREWKPHGIIATMFLDRIERLVRRSGLPSVHVGFQKTTFPTVRTDDAAVGRIVARHFLDNGFRRFAYFSCFGTIWSQQRCDGFVDELASAGFQCNISKHRYIGIDESDWLKNRRKVDQWLQALDKPIAIMCVHDTRGSEVAWACRRVGLRVPDDVAIVGVENRKLICQSSYPPLSSVELDPKRNGYRAAELLDRLLHGGKPPKEPISIPPLRVIVRQSSDIVAIDDPYVTEALRLIRSHAGQAMNVKEIMGKILISRRSLEQRFKSILGRTPWEEIIRVRLNKAKTLLEETDWSIPKVAQGAGFSGPEVFATSFHRELGLAPRDHRRNWRKANGHLSSFG